MNDDVVRSILAGIGLMALVTLLVALVLYLLGAANVVTCKEITGEVAKIREPDSRGDLEYVVIVRYQEEGQPQAERLEIDETTFYRYDNLTEGDPFNLTKTYNRLGESYIYLFQGCPEVTR